MRPSVWALQCRAKMENLAQIGTLSDVNEARWSGTRDRRAGVNRSMRSASSVGALVVFLTLVEATACSSNPPSGDVAEDISTVVDGAVDAVDVADAGIDSAVHAAAGPQVNTGDPPAIPCYTPLQREIEPAQLMSTGVQGCACETYDAGPDGIGRAYCLSGRAVWCPREKGTWIVGADGPCSPLGGPRREQICTELLGGNTVASGTSCPSGFASEGGFQSAANAGTLLDCCYPIRVSANDCMQAGFEVLQGSSTDNVLRTTCSNGHTMRGFVGASGTTVCCERD